MDRDQETTQLWHLAELDDWATAQVAGFYDRSTRGASLAEVGFVHCSYPHQLSGVVAAVYSDVVGEAVVLELDRRLLEVAGSAVRDEPGDPSDPSSELFPHIYGPVPTSAVVQVLRARIDRGRLELEEPTR